MFCIEAACRTASGCSKAAARRVWPALVAGAAALGALGSACTAAAPTVAHRVGTAKRIRSDAPADPAHNLLKESTFEGGAMLPWTYGFYADAAGVAGVRDGALCATLSHAGAEPWEAQFRHREILIERGHHYVLSFRAWASRETRFVAKVGMLGAPYTDFLAKVVNAEPEPRQYSYQFDMDQADEPTAEVAFHFGGRMFQGDGPLEICFDDIVLSDPAFTPPPAPEAPPLPTVRVNQLGYLPHAPKVAAWISDSPAPVPFRLVDARGVAVFQGMTHLAGEDPVSGDALHWLDFTPHDAEGGGYSLEVGAGRSDPFRISAKLYEELERDAFRYFYHNRSGTPIVLPFAGQGEWARPAGHASDVAACAPDIGCDYSLDTTGGWYDAGDHGKYLVDGGISVWTLLNWHERTQFQAAPNQVFADDSGLIPESGNGIPDVLDEARWELEFFLKMQVPPGLPHAGMAHHKVHDDRWTEIATAPHEDVSVRYLRPVSTAATLNLAATAAQAARLFRAYDAAFAQRCESAAVIAFAAAKREPARYALPSDATGGVAYDDDRLDDEFYWAAAELYLTTGRSEYRDEVRRHELDVAIALDPDGVVAAMSWRRVDVLGKISLALHESSAGGTETNYRTQLEGLAERLLAPMTSGYRVPFGVAGGAGYPPASNSLVINNLLVLGLAHDFTKRDLFRDGVVLGMDYLLGRNPLAKSFVSGYGARPLTSPHHRFWARSAHPDYPPPYPGALAGGPSSALEDPYVKAAGLRGCAPQKCYVDHIEAWSVNEVSISRNAPLAWVVAWLAEHAG